MRQTNKNSASNDIEQLLAKRKQLNHISSILDDAFKMPVLNIRIGWDAIIGLVPIVGDIIGALLTSYLVWQAVTLNVPKIKIARMLFNIAIELLVGLVPVLGDLFDISWRANRKNYHLIESHVDKKLSQLDPRMKTTPSLLERVEDHFDWQIIGIIIGLLVGGYLLINHYKKDIYDFAVNLGAKQAQLSPHQININNHSIHYLENPNKATKPTLLMVHGFGAFKENWVTLAIELKDYFHVVALDLPGHGSSDYYPTQNYDIDFQVDTIHHFASKVIGRPFYMVGNSMGGAITALYAATYPNDILGAVLLDPGHITDVKSELSAYLEKGVHPLIVENEDDFEFLVDFTMEQPPFIPWPMPAVSTQKMVDRKHKNEKIWQDITGSHQYNFKEAITNISAPTLIAWGKQDRVLHYKNAYIFQELIPNSKAHIFENVGHAPMIEIPKETARVLIEFFQL